MNNEVEAQHGNKMISIQLRFHTVNIADEKDHIIPKHAWAGGTANIKVNKAHGIEAKTPLNFHSLFEIPEMIERLLLEHNITIHPTTKMLKYLKSK
jgi:hypothetical protein